jgi:hypothetical protein
LKNFGDGANSAAVGQFFDDARRKSQEAAEQIAADGERMRGSFGGMSDAAAEEAVKATSALESLQRDVQAFGMSEMDKKLFEFKLTTDDPAQIEKYAALLGRLDELQVGKQVEEKVKAFRQSMQTPLDKFNEQAAEWRKWLEEGLISKDEFDAAVQKGQEDLAKNSPAAKERETGRDPQFASFVKAGSAEAIKLAFNAQIGGGKDELPQKQLTVAERSRDILGRIEEKLNFEVA